MRTRSSSVAERARRVRFQRLVEAAVRSLPTHIRTQLHNVEIVVENEPTDEQRAEGGSDDHELFGLYEGTPLAERDGGYTMALPDRIVIFRGPLERAFDDPNEMIEEVRITVLHEIAHHFGFDEDQIERMGLA